MAKLKEVFESKTEDGTVLNLAVIKPTPDILTAGDKVYNKTFWDAVKDGGVIKARASQFARDQGLWDDARQAELDKIDQEISLKEKKLADGGIYESEARQVSIDIRVLRNKRSALLADRNAFEDYTCESQAENKRFAYLVSACCVDNEKGNKYFKSFDDYLARASEQVAFDAASALVKLIYGDLTQSLKSLPENKFLLEHGFVDDKLRFVDKQGRLCDSDGRLIDEQGRYITEDHKLCNIDGDLVNDEGFVIGESKPFLKDE